MASMEGKVVLVTAGATGIGFGCAEAIVGGGGRVMICARREETLIDAAGRLGKAAEWVVCDVTDDASVDAAVAATLSRMGRIDGLVNSAGVGSGGAILDLATEELDRVLDANLKGSFRCLRAVGRALRDAGHGGSIVNISSIAGALTHPWMSSYCISKAAVDMLTRCAADELGEHGIRVNSILPGIVETPLAAVLSSQDVSREEYLRLMPISRIGRPEDVGRMVAFLLSDDASWITGQALAVDGGHTLRKGPDLRPLFRQLAGDG